MFFLLASTNRLTNFANSRVYKPNVSLTDVLRFVLILFTSIFSIFALSFFFEEQTQLRSTKVNNQRGESYFPYILLNEIQTMFSQFAKRSARVLPADLCTDHAHYVKNIDQRFSISTQSPSANVEERDQELLGTLEQDCL